MPAPAILIAKFALAAAVAPHAVPSANQDQPPQAQQQQQPVGDATEQKGETPTTTQASPASTEPKPSNAASPGTIPQTRGTAIDTSTGPSRAAAGATAAPDIRHPARKAAHHRRRHRKRTHHR